METLLLFVQELKAEGLYAADDPPLVADQLHPKMPHISRSQMETQETNAHAHSKRLNHMQTFHLIIFISQVAYFSYSPL